MTEKEVWLITGAGRGMGVDIAKAALAAGHAVVATGRNPDTVKQAVGDHEDLLVVALDVTSPASAEVATQAAVDRFGRIDVLVNNAGNFYAGYFEEFTPEQINAQLAANLLGPMNATCSRRSTPTVTCRLRWQSTSASLLKARGKSDARSCSLRTA